MTFEQETRFTKAMHRLDEEKVEYVVSDEYCGLLKVYDDDGALWLYYASTGTIIKASNRFKPKRQGLTALLDCIHGKYNEFTGDLNHDQT